jgi:membrane protease YdiL (CAAX protease family)
VEKRVPDPAVNDESHAYATLNRLIAAWEIASVTLSFLMAEWIIRPSGGSGKLIGALPLGIALILMFLSHRARGEGLRDIGWRLDNLWAASRFLLLPMLGGAILILLLGWLNGGFRSGKLQIWQWLLWLPVWGLIQQYSLQGFINRRAQIVWGKGYRSVLLVAVIFALLHLPNPWLTFATFVGGLFWAVVYQRTPNLIALALSHSLMSVLLVWSLPASILKSLRVGFRYFL